MLLLCAVAGLLVRREGAAGGFPPLLDLFTELDARLPTGYYRGPSLVTTRTGSLLAVVLGGIHRHDGSPTIVYLRRSTDGGATWSSAAPILADPTNRTHFTGALVADPATGAVHFVFQQDVYTTPAPPRSSGCLQHVISSLDDGLSWGLPRPARLAPGRQANATFGKALGSGIALTRGAHAGRLVVAMRGDCGGGEGSLVLFSDDGGATWAGGARMVLLPQFGGGWTEAEAAELANGSVLMTSRNLYGRSSGQGPRLFARSDDGGETWAANWSAGPDLPDPYCEASIVAGPGGGKVYLGNPSNARARGNFSVHVSADGGLTWPAATVLYPGPAAYSDVAITQNGSAPALAYLFERDNYRFISFGTVPLDALAV